MEERTESEEDGAFVRPAVVGRHKPPGGPSNDPAYHPVGFGTALQHALDATKEALFADEDLGEGTPFDVVVTFEATVSIRNPGWIDEYRALVGFP
jgi:hypothetical protein